MGFEARSGVEWLNSEQIGYGSIPQWQSRTRSAYLLFY
jgi:hypothetical protein